MPARSTRQGGFTVVEALVSAGLLLIIAIGILPLFAQAITSNRSGKESTDVANHVRSRLDEFFELPWDAPQIQVTAGTETVVTDFFAMDPDALGARSRQGAWQAVLPATGELLWTRTTTVEQYAVDDLTTPLPAGSAPEQVHLKRIIVQVVGRGDSMVLGPGKELTAEVWKTK